MKLSPRKTWSLALIAGLLLAGCAPQNTPPASPAGLSTAIAIATQNAQAPKGTQPASAAPTQGPRTWFVAQDAPGADCTETAPCTPAIALSRVQPGDTLTIQGTLTTSLTITQSGTPESWITITGGAIAAPPSDHDALLVEGSYLELKDLEVTGGDEFGVRVKGHDVRLTNLQVHDTVWENRSGDYCMNNTDGGWGRAVTFAPGASNVEVSGGAVYNNCGEGIAFTMNDSSHLHDIQVYDNYSVNVYIANASNVSVEKVTSYYSNPAFYRGGQPGHCIRLGIESSDFPTYGNMMHDIAIRRNQLTDCQGISLYLEVDGQAASRVTVENNTFTRVPSPQVDIPGTDIAVANNSVTE